MARTQTTTAKDGTIHPVGGRGIEAERTPRAIDPRGEEEAEGRREEIVPEGYDSEAAFLNEWLNTYTLDYAADKHNRDEAFEDLRFTFVDQWDSETRKEREEEGRPCITVNTAPQFIGQVVGDRRINKTSIKIIPMTQKSKAAAETRSGLITAIENFSMAERVYDMCCEDQVAAGVSNFEITMEYATNDAFDLDLWVRPLANPFGVTWDRVSRDPTGRDARHCFVEDEMPLKDFEKQFPDMPIPSGFPAGVEGDDWTTWVDQETVKLCALWIMIEKPATFALMADGEVEDVTGLPEEEWLHRVYIDENNQYHVKEGVRTYAQRWLISGFAILDGPYELPLSRLPIIKVTGRVGRVGTKQYRFGLIRWARDSFLMRNYWRSVACETLAMAPRSQWIAEQASVKGMEDDFRTAHLTGDPLLTYVTGRKAPERIDPPSLPAAVLNEVAMNTQDIKDVTGLQDASLGIRSNEVSGKAIMARQREGDVATVTFHDHLNAAIQEGGRVINELIPVCYDTCRTIVIVGKDEQHDFVTVNDPNDEASPNLTFGKYDVQVITGPSYTTQRQEAAEAMLEATKVMPELMAQAMDIVVEVQDWPGSQRIADRFKKIIPAAQQEEQEKKQAEAEATGQQLPPDPAQAQAEQAAAMQQQMAQAAMEAQAKEMELKLAEMQAKVEQAQAQAREAASRAIEAEARVEEAQHKARAARANADEAESKAEQADDAVVFHAHERAQKIRQTDEQPASTGGDQSGSTKRNKPRKGNAK